MTYAECIISWPLTSRLYLPEIWANDAERGKKAHSPEEVRFQTKVEITLDTNLNKEFRKVGGASAAQCFGIRKLNPYQYNSFVLKSLRNY